jgi:hypothetical protein
MLHFSNTPVSIGTQLVGLKAAHKGRQRAGQRVVDEIFESVRKSEFPSKPSLFTSLWVTDVFDPSIARKAFEEGAETAWLYEGEPVGEIVEVELHWEVLACRAITQSAMSGQELRRYVEEMARKFWLPEIVPGRIRDFLCPLGAIVIKQISVVSQADVVPTTINHRSCQPEG